MFLVTSLTTSGTGTFGILATTLSTWDLDWACRALIRSICASDWALTLSTWACNGSGSFSCESWDLTPSGNSGALKSSGRRNSPTDFFKSSTVKDFRSGTSGMVNLGISVGIFGGLRSLSLLGEKSFLTDWGTSGTISLKLLKALPACETAVSIASERPRLSAASPMALPKPLITSPALSNASARPKLSAASVTALPKLSIASPSEDVS
mmetsp:Transcript_147261/g.257263  ORF Transcript_147261/g.257263 Transcript_147261/m.257263 type:complete len:209 (-) Transcript_147261:788-1414(-)